MAVTAKNASKCKNYWYQPSLQTSIDTLVPVADLISPNLRSSGFPGKPGQEFSPKIAYFWRSKMFLQDCIVGLGYKNTASHVCMNENFKFNHVFCNNFCNNWAKIRQCAVLKAFFASHIEVWVHSFHDLGLHARQSKPPHLARLSQYLDLQTNSCYAAA